MGHLYPWCARRQFTCVIYVQFHIIFRPVLGGTQSLSINDPSLSEKTPLLSSVKANGVIESEDIVDEDGHEDLVGSEQHKAKDFQLIHVPKEAVSL